MVLYLVVCGFMLGRLLGVCFMELIDMLLDVVGFGLSCDCLCFVFDLRGFGGNLLRGWFWLFCFLFVAGID